MLVLFTVQNMPGPLAALRRAGADINCHVKYPTLRHPDQFALRILFLKMQAAQHAMHGFTVVVLYEYHIQTRDLVEFALVKTFEKETARV